MYNLKINNEHRMIFSSTTREEELFDKILDLIIEEVIPTGHAYTVTQTEDISYSDLPDPVSIKYVVIKSEKPNEF